MKLRDTYFTNTCTVIHYRYIINRDKPVDLYSLTFLIHLLYVQVYEKFMSLSSADSNFLLLLKLDFYRIVSAHEHFVTLNLPLGTMPPGTSAPSSPTPSCSSTSSYTSTNTLTEKGLFTELSSDYRSQHFLVGLILSELVVVADCG